MTDIIIDGILFSSALTVDEVRTLAHFKHEKKMPSGLMNMGFDGMFCGEAVHGSCLFDEKGRLLKMLLWVNYVPFMEHPELYDTFQEDLTDDLNAVRKWLSERTELEEGIMYDWGCVRCRVEQWSGRAALDIIFR